ncbi:MAG: flavonol synthase [Ponticaulis sp.]|nr:flavonol synthase [Ponticaulis sp.]|tara:strand:- start:29929 stop:30888 length:960 start_codon:yes stop_codon:yes gene_type:complete
MLTTLKPISLPADEADDAEFTKALMAAFMETGFAVISNHGLDQSVIDQAYAVSRDFFSLPAETKQKYFDPEGAGQRGYTPFGTENAKGNETIDLKEFWHTGRELPENHAYAAIMPETPSVSEVPTFDTATRDLFEAFDALGARLLRSVASGLGLPRDWFADKVRYGNSILRLLHYPAQTSPPPEGSVRAAAHEDINVITLLLGADEAGLQVRPRGHDDWISIEAPKGSLVINVGDMLQRLTNHVLQSTTHQVINPAPERSRFSRYSLPFFLHFEPDVQIRSLESCVTEDNPDRYPEPITANEYLLERLEEIGLLKRKPG